MIRVFCLYAIMILVFCGKALAIETPKGSKFDGRIQNVVYNPGDVVVIHAVPGRGARIVFSSNETILDIASGFTDGWEFADRRNVLYIKPKSLKATDGQSASLSPEPGKWNTNLMVATTARLYDFDLRLISALTRKTSYRVEFKYPDEDAAKAKLEEGKKKAQARLDAKAAPRNWNYTMQIGENSSGIAPAMAYDDGRFTYLKFPNNRDFPTAFLVSEDKTESIINSHVEDNDILVLHRVSPEFVLRLGNAVVGIYNERFDINGVPPKDGTTVPGVQRIVISEDDANDQEKPEPATSASVKDNSTPISVQPVGITGEESENGPKQLTK